MTETTAVPAITRTPAVAGLAAATGLSALGMAAYQLATPGAPQAAFGSLSDWIRDLLFLAYLMLTVAALVVARARGIAPGPVLGLVGAGHCLIAVGVTVGLVLQEDPSWFVVLGGPGVLLSVVGFVTWAVVGARRGTLPTWAAVWCALGGLVAILGSETGLSAIVGTFWLWLSLRRW